VFLGKPRAARSFHRHTETFDGAKSVRSAKRDVVHRASAAMWPAGRFDPPKAGLSRRMKVKRSRAFIGVAGTPLLGIMILALMVLGNAGIAAAQTPSKVPVASAARLGGDIQRTRFVTDLTTAVGFSVYVLPDPFRVIIDMPEVNFQLPPGLGSAGHGLVGAYRYGLFASGKSRIVLDAVEPVLIQKSFVLKPQNDQPARLVVDLVRTDRSTFFKIHNLVDRSKATQPEPAAVTFDQPALAPLPKPRPKPALKPAADPRVTMLRPPVFPKPKPRRRPRKKIIIIDPGHGGVDPGAMGRRGTPEKRIVLEFSKILKRHLEATGKYKVFMTRSTDAFIKLNDRVKFARQHNGDLFIAVHADAISRRKQRIRGATVYTLSNRATDKEAAELAARENKSDLIAGVDLETQNVNVTGILIDLAQRATNRSSVAFAKTVVGSMAKVTRMTSVPHRQAGFRVLKAPDIPSILLELGYVSNNNDEKLLRSNKWRNKVSAAVVKAIKFYFKRNADTDG